MNPAHEEDASDRTHRLAKLLGGDPAKVQNLTGRRVVLEIGWDAAASDVGKLAFLTLCNLASRLGPYVPNLDVAVPVDATALDSLVYRPGGPTLRDQALWILRAAIPTDGLVRQVADPTCIYDLAVSIGQFTVAAKARVRSTWRGWMAIVGDDDTVVPSVSETNPFGALTAAAMATARLHAVQLALVGAKIPPPTKPWRLNALTLADDEDGPTLPMEGLRMPRALLVGAGALGSSFTYAMAHVPGLHGEIDAIDPDVLKPSNANRQVTAPFERALDAKTKKVDDLAACWTAVTPIALSYDAFKVKHGRSAGDYELAITAVDNAEARREVAKDLPKVLIDGATGGLMVALMRGANPTDSCVACAYAEIVTDEDGVWSRRLGLPRDRIQSLREGALPFDDDVLRQIKEEGTLAMDDETEEGLRGEGWSYLARARCGSARPDRDLPAASVSYVSAISGFLMAAQVMGEILGVRVLLDPPRWEWADVLRHPPEAAERVKCDASPSCLERHERRSRIYQGKWP